MVHFYSATLVRIYSALDSRADIVLEDLIRFTFRNPVCTTPVPLKRFPVASRFKPNETGRLLFSYIYMILGRYGKVKESGVFRTSNP